MKVCVLGYGALGHAIVEQLGDAFRLVDGEYKLKTDWGISSAAPKNGYLIIYGLKDDGRLDANILTVGTPSFANYFVVTEEGKLGEPLEEHHKKVINPTKR